MYALAASPACLALLHKGSRGRFDYGILDETDAHDAWRAQLFGSSSKAVRLQIKVALAGCQAKLTGELNCAHSTALIGSLQHAPDLRQLVWRQVLLKAQVQKSTARVVAWRSTSPCARFSVSAVKHPPLIYAPKSQIPLSYRRVT